MPKIGYLCSMEPRFKDISQQKFVVKRNKREILKNIYQEGTGNVKVLIELGNRDRTAIK